MRQVSFIVSSSIPQPYPFLDSLYFSYGEWGLGLKNKTSDSSDSVGKMTIDQIFPKNGTADAFKLKIDLRRTNASFASPVVTLIALTFMLKQISHFSL